MSTSGRLLGWLLGLPPVRSPSLRVQRDSAIPERDGVALMADRYFPAADPKAPVGLIRTPYGRRSANILVSRLIAERGYQVLIQSLRGTGGSGGTFNGFAMNHDDGPATIKWMRGAGLVSRCVCHVGRQLPRVRPMGPRFPVDTRMEGSHH
jgi:predicted acyl esterase